MISDIIRLAEKEEDIDKATNALKAIAHPLRLKILCILRSKEMSVLEIVKQTGSSQSNISQHIEILRTKQIVESRRAGAKVLCKVKDAKILKLITHIHSVFCG